jgi:hypothetical protein
MEILASHSLIMPSTRMDDLSSLAEEQNGLSTSKADPMDGQQRDMPS